MLFSFLSRSGSPPRRLSSFWRRAWQSGPQRRRTRSIPLCVQQLETRLTPSLSALASFSGTNGAGPTDPVIMDGSGNLYGTTTGGGAYGDGTVFELAHGSGAITTLASFNGTNGSDPVAALLMDSGGNLYSTTATGGAHGDGTVFELAHGSGTIDTLASFSGPNGGTGRQPRAPLVMDSSGNLYGTTDRGGASIYGTVFELVHGSGTITTLASFNGSNGEAPLSGLLIDSSGNLYGTTFSDSTLFEVAHGSDTITVLASIGTAGDSYYTPLVMDSSGNLYGAAVGGGDSVDGAVFELAHGSNTISTLASFNGTTGNGPIGLNMDSSGNLYGTTEYGGASNDGTIYELAQGSGTITTLASFNGTNGNGPSGLLMDSSGNLYGTTSNGGASNDGTVFELSSGPSFAVSGFPATATAGQSGTITVTALNANGSINTSYSGTVQFTSSDPHAILPAPTTLTNGTGTFNLTLVTAGTQSITATDTSNSGITGSEGGITITAGAATQFVISGPTSVASGTSFSITVTAEDAYGNIATGYTGTVHFTDSASGATLPANYTFTSGDIGAHTFSKLKLKTKGWQTITVTDTLNNTILGTWLIDVT